MAANILSETASFSHSSLYCQILDSNHACRGVMPSAEQAAIKASCRDSLAGLLENCSLMAFFLGLVWRIYVD